MFKNIKHIHFIGIGGIGMSGIAEILNSMGYRISGSDMKDSAIIERLRSLGLKIYIGHAPDNANDSDIIVYSSAVKFDNPEILYAKQMNIPVIPRADMLAELMRLKYSVAIAGTHGKTTTTSMTGHVLDGAGFDPTIIVGGIVKSMSNTNARLGTGKFLIAEADESDRSFIRLLPTIAVITNIDEDHLDNYHDIHDIKDNFMRFASSIPFNGSVIMCCDDANTAEIARTLDKRKILYGFSAQADMRAVNPVYGVMSSEYTFVANNMPLGRIQLKVPGKHNVLNSLAALSVGLDLGISFDKIKAGIESFEGVSRRFEIIYSSNKRNIVIVDDYAHHPAEIYTVIESARQMGIYRLVTIFQPHLYSRTMKLCSAFGSVLALSDITVTTDIYPARETPVEGVTGRMLHEEIMKTKKSNVYYVEDKEDIPQFLSRFDDDNTVFLFVGAGDINRISMNFKQVMEKNADN